MADDPKPAEAVFRIFIKSDIQRVWRELTKQGEPQGAIFNAWLHGTGRTIAELHAEVAASGAAKHGERRSWLMERHKLGYGDANAVALFFGKPLPSLDGGTPTAATPATEGDPLDALYTGAKAVLLPLHEAVMAQIRTFGDFKQAPKKSYVSLRRKKQFAMVGPATKDSIEIGLNAKDQPEHGKLKPQPAGSMCNATTRITGIDQVDAQLRGWLKQAYDAAG